MFTVGARRQQAAPEGGRPPRRPTPELYTATRLGDMGDSGTDGCARYCYGDSFPDTCGVHAARCALCRVRPPLPARSRRALTLCVSICSRSLASADYSGPRVRQVRRVHADTCLDVRLRRLCVDSRSRPRDPLWLRCRFPALHASAAPANLAGSTPASAGCNEFICHHDGCGECDFCGVQGAPQCEDCKRWPRERSCAPSLAEPLSLTSRLLVARHHPASCVSSSSFCPSVRVQRLHLRRRHVPGMLRTDVSRPRRRLPLRALPTDAPLSVATSQPALPAATLPVPATASPATLPEATHG
jgi:hypothetical protein